MKNKKIYFFIPIIVLIGMALGLLGHWLGYEQYDDIFWMVTLIIGTIPLLIRMAKSIFKGEFGVDIIAITAIVTAFILKQYLAGTVIVLMLSGGEALEYYALVRARKELTSLLSKAPTTAHLKKEGGVVEVAAEQIKPNDIVIVKPGELVPVDGLVISGNSNVDESSLTGESLPVEKDPGSQVHSGSINKENLLEVRALRTSHESKFEQIIKLVREAEESKAPVVRLADRYSIWFTAVTFVLAALAWFLSHDPVRLLAVLVVATPCPLILATPIAVISGISRAASRGIIIKSGGALETLGEAKAFVFDKTGTLTLGSPKVLQFDSTKPGTSAEEVLKIAGSLDQLSAHILAKALVKYAKGEKKVGLVYPEDFQEFFGDGVSGNINKERYYFGRLEFLEKNTVKISKEIEAEHTRLQEEGIITVYLAKQNELIGDIHFADVLRPEVRNLFKNIEWQGIKKIVMLTGDKQGVAEKIAKDLSIRDFHAECLPEDKLSKLKHLQKDYSPVVMIGDGVNDAPALASADVGIALGAGGSAASSDASDIVILVNNLQRVGQALAIAKRVLRIAKESIFVGMGVSTVLMVIAALGYIQPVYGALLQEVLDVGVILNALRVHFGKLKY